MRLYDEADHARLLPEFEELLNEPSEPDDIITESEFPALVKRHLSGSVGHNARNLGEDVRSVQQLLNIFIIAGRLPGVKFLAVDGKAGRNTIIAIKAFQKAFVGMDRPDGRVDPGGRTLAKLNGSVLQPAATIRSGGSSMTHTGPLPQVNTLMPSSAPGLLAQKPQSHRYGLPETIDALRKIGQRWESTHPAAPRIQIRDISRHGGGLFKPHGSHRMGIDVDIALMRNDGREALVNFKLSPGIYSRSLTQDMVDTIRANGILKVHRIYFSDRKVRNVDYDNIHNNHIHVRFCVPRKYDLASMKRAAFPGGTKGTYARCPV